MNTLLLLRHAKSSWSDGDLSDFDRPLAPRGVKAAIRMGRFMRESGMRPDVVLCSAARRTRETWALVAAALEPPREARVVRALYEAEPGLLLETVRAEPASTGILMVIGHNPGLERFAAHLARDDSDRDSLAAMSRKFPTAALARLEFDDVDPRAIGESSGRLTLFVAPKRFQQ